MLWARAPIPGAMLPAAAASAPCRSHWVRWRALREDGGCASRPVDKLHRRQKAIAALGECLDIVGRFGFVAEGGAQFAHSGIQPGVKVDEGFALPQMLVQLGPRDQISLALRESREHAQRLLLDRDADAVLAQLS